MSKELNHLNIGQTYELPKDPFGEEVLIPAFSRADSVSCMVGFFTSAVFSEIAAGLATFLNESDGKFNLIISPVLSESDLNAIKEGLKSEESVFEDLVNGWTFTEDLVQRHTLRVLAWMISCGRLSMKIALMKSGGVFHSKVWLFKQAQNLMVASGSANATGAALSKNSEIMTVARSWDGTAESAQKLQSSFDLKWNDQDEAVTIVPIPRACEEQIIKTYKTENIPTESDLMKLMTQSSDEFTNFEYVYPEPPDGFSIPEYLEYESGDFEHQGKAVSKWLENDCNGILDMATGSGKTITSMICTSKLLESQEKLFVLVSAPYRPLINQWCDEIREFNIEPVNFSGVNPDRRKRIFADLRRKLSAGVSKIEIVVSSINLLTNQEFLDECENMPCKKLLIADEVHNLGRDTFIENPPEFFHYRMGLSATPERQFEPEKSNKLKEFFGPVIFSYSLEEAIGHCLVPYDYHVEIVHLTEIEMEKWHLLTDKIKRIYAIRKIDDPDDSYLERLYSQRREILENAEGKIKVLKNLLTASPISNLKYTLVYCSDKNPEQLQQINLLLRELNIRYHQLTYQETGSAITTEDILTSFRKGNLQMMTAMRVLDEGVNIPEIECAYILASTTVERQWVQRRGRLLRKSPKTCKVKSIIYDFIVIPPDTNTQFTSDEKKLVRSELKRIREFANLSSNKYEKSGALAVMDDMVNLLNIS